MPCARMPSMSTFGGSRERRSDANRRLLGECAGGARGHGMNSVGASFAAN